MTIAFYFIAFLILLHECLVWIGLHRVPKVKHYYLTLLQSGFMAIAAVVAMIYHSWEILIVSFIISRLWVMMELGIQGYKIQKRPSKLIFSNAVVVVLGLVSLFTDVWLYFIMGYGAFWGLTLVIGMTLTSRQANLRM